MANYCRLSSQVSTDAVPAMPRATPCMNFDDMSYDAVAGHRNLGQRGLVNNTSQPLQIPNNAQARQASRVQRQTGTSSQKGGNKLSSLSKNDVEKTEEGIKKISISLESEADSSYSSMELSSSLPSAGWEDDIKKYQEFMPLNVKIGYFDALILYAEEDRDAAEKFRLHLMNEIDIRPERVTAMLYDCPELTTLSGSQIGQLALAVERSTYVFMYLSKHFVKDKWMEFSSESCLMTAIYDKDKQWCVVPVYTEKRSKCTFKIPMGLNSLKGINYYNNDEFYKRGVARLINDKVPLRKQLNEKHKIKQKQWVEEYKRKQLELHEQQRRTEIMEEGKTAQMMKWLRDETRRLEEAGIIPQGFHHSYSEGHMNTPNHSLQHVASTNSLKDIQSQNPHVATYFQDLLSQNKEALNRYTPEERAVIKTFYEPPATYNHGSCLPVHEDPQLRISPSRPSPTLQGDNPVSTINNGDSTINTDVNFVNFSLQNSSGVDLVKIPKVLYDEIFSLTDEEKNNYVGIYFESLKENNKGNQLSSDMSQFQLIQTKSKLLHSSNPEHENGVPGNNIHSVEHPGNSFTNFQNPIGGGGTSIPHGQPGLSGNQPIFSELLSGSSSRTSGSYSHGEYNTGSGASLSTQQLRFTSQDGNLPNSGLFESLEDDGSSYRANSATNNQGSNMLSSTKEESLQSLDKGRHTEEHTKKSNDTKAKKIQKAKREKHEVVHYTINVYGANAVQVGNQNMVSSVGNVEVDGEDMTEDEIRKPKVKVAECLETKEPSHSTQVLKKDPDDAENDGLVTRGEQPSPSSQGSCHLDAALSSAGSQPMVYSHSEQTEPKVTKQKSVIEPENMTTSANKSISNQKPGSVSQAYQLSDESLVTNQLPEGLKKILLNDGNIEGSVSEEKSSLKDKVILDEVVQKEAGIAETNQAAEFNRQDSRLKSDANPVVAVISPMRPKIPSESGDCTEVKEVVPSEQTAVKVVTDIQSTINRATNVNQTSAQVLTKSGLNTDADLHSGSNNSMKNSSEGCTENKTYEQRETFSMQRLTNATDLFYPNRIANRGRVSPIPSRFDVSSSSTFQGGSSEGFVPGPEPVSSHDIDKEYVMLDSDCFDDGFSRIGESSTRRPRTKAQSANKPCVIS